MNIASPHKQLDLVSAIAEGDIRCLLMVLVHMTGDERWLEPPYLPKRDIRLIPDPEAGVPGRSRTKSAPQWSSCLPTARQSPSSPIPAKSCC